MIENLEKFSVLKGTKQASISAILQRPWRMDASSFGLDMCMLGHACVVQATTGHWPVQARACSDLTYIEATRSRVEKRHGQLRALAG